ncbi:ABC transporter permease [Nocardiopsis ansamitocini]|uniref:Peptide ABC transporter permease n=1 Tax=Nocardiopsis ansamitocini TaxID=1670832 RepID=A0A9W6P370_9ACTN|nr:ABC transporter permease [Nocardiopsis ansamitocini]GLU46395.1 peptide ABC transporter permease [Nocardiopsis ansamitocini]
MVRFLLRRLVGKALLLVVAASCAHLLAATALDPRGNYEGQRPPPPAETVDALLDEYNLNPDTPLAERYLVWASGVVTGDFGRSWDGSDVTAQLVRRVGVSLRLLALGAALGALGGVLLGALAASRHRGGLDRTSVAVSLLVISTPAVVVAVSLQSAALWVNQVTGSELLRATGEFTPGLNGGPVAQVMDRARHLLLPTLTVALPQIALFSRYQRNLMLDEAGSDYVRTARAKGLTKRAALFRHGLRTALGPAVTYFGYSSALLFASAVFTEKVFGWHGVGEYLLDSVGRGDVHAVAAVCCFGALCVVTAGLLADIGRFLVDPRTRVL